MRCGGAVLGGPEPGPLPLAASASVRPRRMEAWSQHERAEVDDSCPFLADTGHSFLKLLPTATAKDEHWLKEVHASLGSHLKRINPRAFESEATARRASRRRSGINIEGLVAPVDGTGVRCPGRTPQTRQPSRASGIVPRLTGTSVAKAYDIFAEKINRRVVQASFFEPIVTSGIVVVFVTSFIDAWYEFPHPSTPLGFALEIISNLVLVLFTFEMVVKVVARGVKPHNYFICPHDGYYNTMDCGIVVGGWITFGQNNPISVLRLLRLLRVMSKINQLQVILNGLFAGLSSVMNIMLILLLIIYLIAIGGVTLFGARPGHRTGVQLQRSQLTPHFFVRRFCFPLCAGRNDPVHFGSVVKSMLTFVRIATFAGWNEVFYINYYGCDKFDGGVYRQTNGTLSTISTRFGTFSGFDCYAPEQFPIASTTIFLGFSIVAGFVIISLFVGVITMGLFDELEKNESGWRKRTSLKRKIEAKKTFFGDDGRDFIKTKMNRVFGNQLANANPNVPKWFILLSIRCQHLAESALFNNFVTGLILIVCLLIGVQTNMGSSSMGSDIGTRSDSGFRGFFKIFDFAALGAFTIEIIVKLLAEGVEPRRYFNDNWNCFDFFVVALSFSVIPFEIKDVAILRLIRVFRVLKLAHGFQQLKVLVEVLIAMVVPMAHTLIIFMVINFTFGALHMNYIAKESCDRGHVYLRTAMFGRKFFGSNDPHHFGK